MSSSKNSRAHTSILSLSNDSLVRIFSHLPPSQLARCSAVCSNWYDIISGDASPWKKYCGMAMEDSDVDWQSLAISREQQDRLHKGPVLLHILDDCKSRINCCSMRGPHIVTGVSDKTVRVWDNARSRLAAILKSPASVTDLELDDVKIVGAAGGEVVVWNRTTGRILKRIASHGQTVKAIRFEDTEVLAGCSEGSLRVFDLYSSDCKQIFRPHTDAVTAVAVGWPLRLVASGSRDGTVQVHHMDNSQPVASLLSPNPTQGVECLHLADDGYTLTAGTSAGYLHRWDLRSADKQIHKQKLYASALTTLHAADYSPSTLVTGGLSGVIHVLDGYTCQPVRSLARPRGLKVPGSTLSIKGSSPLVDFDNQPRRGDDGGSHVGIGHGSVLALRVGMTSIVSCGADGVLALWKFGL